MGNVNYPGDFIYTDLIGMGQPVIPSYLSIESQIKNTENKQTIKLLRKRKFRNVEYI